MSPGAAPTSNKLTACPPGIVSSASSRRVLPAPKYLLMRTRSARLWRASSAGRGSRISGLRTRPFTQCIEYNITLILAPTLRLDLVKSPLVRYACLHMEMVTEPVGWLEVICGPMFSGKSEELIRRLRRARIARKRVQVFKPVIDNRYAVDEIVSHGEQRLKSEVVSDAKDILKKMDC